MLNVQHAFMLFPKILIVISGILSDAVEMLLLPDKQTLEHLSVLGFPLRWHAAKQEPFEP